LLGKLKQIGNGNQQFDGCRKPTKQKKAKTPKDKIMTEQNPFATSELQHLATYDNAQVQLDLAYRYAKDGDGVANKELVFERLTKAAELGLAPAQLALGYYYFFNIDKNQAITLGKECTNLGKSGPFALAIHIASYDDKKIITNPIRTKINLAFTWSKKAAEQGCAEAQHLVASFYDKGIGIEQNNQLAFEWYKKAAEKGLADAQYQLALFYHKGTCGKQNDDLALKWFTSAAEQGYKQATLLLGFLYGLGKGVEQSDQLAFEWLKKSAEQGLADAKYHLAICYLAGKGIKKNDELALKWLNSASGQGHKKAIDLLCISAALYLFETKEVKQNKKLALEGLIKAAELGSTKAHLFLGMSYVLGKGVEQNGELAFVWFKNAAEKGLADAQYWLALCYLDGIGIEKNIECALEWFVEANEQGHVKAKNFLVRGLEAELHRQYANSDNSLEFFGRANSEAVMEVTAESKNPKYFLTTMVDFHNAKKEYNLAEQYVEDYFENTVDTEIYFKDTFLTNIKLSEQLDIKNQELQEKNKQLQEAKNELEDMMSMFAHKFRSPLDAIIYNTTHENQVKLYTEAAQTMRGLLNIFSIISTDAEILKDKIKQDRQGSGRLATVFSKTLDMILLHLLSMSGTEKIQQHYLAYAKAYGQCDAQVSYKTWCEDYFELEQILQAEWEQSFALLLNQSATLEQRLAWLEQHFFKLELIGFERADIQFKEYGVTESLLTILLNEILVNAFKYYSSANMQPVVLEWTDRKGYQVLSCRNPSIRSERDIIKGSNKGHVFLSTLARKTGSAFTKPMRQDDFVVEFGIPDEFLISK
jgi:TPR repeat protein